MQEIRLSASGIIFQQDKVLLVRYKDQKADFLVGPGGGVFPEEDLLKEKYWKKRDYSLTQAECCL
jgi:hypothetical protein